MLVNFNDAKNYHLWSIQDAKDGDVLADDYGIYIFDRFDEHDERCFLCMGVYQYSQKMFENKHMLCSIEVHPATKEQRDLLFSKMKEAGYTFDFEKKELKKIHVIDEGKAEMDYCFTKMMNGEKVSPTWSAEDEDAIGMAIIALEDMYDEDEPNTTFCGYNLPFNKAAERLKSFKQRHTWKPSDEQLYILNWLANVKLGDSVVEQDVSKHLNELYKDLKKLREE